MINIMIVDDEERARDGMKSLIDWQEHQMCIIAEARDGAEALELLAQKPVDILLTDIRMPEIDGLKLIEMVKEKYPHVKSIIMSGYNDFNYAKQALLLGASDYLLKPSRRQEILETVLKVANTIIAERQQSESLDLLKEGFRESLPLLRDKTLSKLVQSEDASYEKLLNRLELSGLVFPYALFGIMLVQIDNLYTYQKRFGTFDIELLKYGLKNISEEMMSDSTFCVAFEEHDDILVILNSDQPLNVDQFISLANKLQINAQRFLNLEVSIGIGSVDKKINQLRNAFVMAKHALDSQYYSGTSKIVDYEEYKEDEQWEYTYPVELEKLIIQSLLSGESAKISSSLDMFFQSLKANSKTKDHTLKFILALYFELYRLCIEKDLNTNEIFGLNVTEMISKLEKSDMDSIYDELLETILQISNELNQKSKATACLIPYSTIFAKTITRISVVIPSLVRFTFLLAI